MDFALSDSAGSIETAGKADYDSKSVTPIRFPVKTDSSRDALLTDFGKDRTGYVVAST